MKRIGILTSGGDCGGLNAVLKGAAQMAHTCGVSCFIIPKGYAGLYNLVDFDRLVELTPERADSINPYLAGSEAGHSRVKIKKIEDEHKYARIKEGLKKFNLEGLVISGGDDTGSVIIDLTGQGTPYAYRSVEAVLAFLDEADSSLGRKLRERYADVIPVFRSDKYGTLTPTERDALTAKIYDLVALMRRERVRLTAATSSDDYDWALHQAVGAAQDDAFLRSLPSELDLRQLGNSPAYFQQGEWWDHKQEMREIAMADNVLWVLQRERARGGRIFFFAANSHVQAGLVIRGSTSRPFTILRYRPAGMYLRSALERDMIVIGTYYGQGAGPDGPWPMDRGGMDGLLSSASIPRFIMDLRELPAAGTLHDWFRVAHSNRGWAGIVAPLENYDAILFFESITQTPAAQRE